MPRIVKDADERRDELLNTALALFLEHGYEHTSVEHITNTVGVAKGTFYHYFETKQDLLEQLVDRFTDDLFEQIETALAETNGSATERFRALLAASTTVKLGRKDETLAITRSLYSGENRALLDRLREGWIVRTRPFITDIIGQGCREGTFEVPDVPAMTEIWLSLWYDYGIRLGELFFRVQEDASLTGELVNAMNTLMLVQERMLGAKPGTLGMDVEPAVRGILGRN